MFKKALSPLFLAIIFSGCAEKSNLQTSMNLAGNRQMAVGFKSLKVIEGKTDADAAFISRTVQKAIASTYGSKVSEIRIEPSTPLESPDHLFQIGKLEVDDLFIVEAVVKGNFETAAASSVNELPADPEATPAPIPTENYIEFSVSIYNGSNLRAVNIFSFRVPTNLGSGFEAGVAEAFKKSSRAAFSNPNIYPKSNPKHFADLLFAYSESKEKDTTNPLTCDNAPDRLRYYSAAKTLYEISAARGNNRVVGTQSESHALAQRTIESGAKAKILEECVADQQKGYVVNVDYGSLNPSNQVFVQKAFESSNFDPVLRQYTAKPVLFKFQVEEDGRLSLFVEIRFDRAKYQAWTAGRIPQKIKAFQVLSLDPYYALMQKLVLFKNSLPDSAPFSLRAAFENMKMMLSLKTLINGEVAFAVDGRYIKDQNRLAMAYPNTMFITSPGFETRSISNKNQEIFQQKGWVSLGNCKTIEGAKTEDGLLYDFFGFPCQ